MNAAGTTPATPLLAIAEPAFERGVVSALEGLLHGMRGLAGARFSRAPVVVSPVYLARLRRLGLLLDTALRAIVARYFRDERVRATYRLPAALEEILRQADGTPYRVGFYRPDFVYDVDGQPRICEIGARYAMNGWMISRLAAAAFAAPAAAAGFAGQAEQDAFMQTLRALHPAGSTVALVHASEPGTEIFHVRDELRRQGTVFVQAHPAELRLGGGRILVRGQAIDRCILEMDRGELPLMPADVLGHLVRSGAYFNDVRTLILVHDKRVLAVLCDEDIMRDCMDPADFAELRPYLIPSRVAEGRDGCAALLEHPGDLIAKRNSGGRGIGSVVRSACGEAAWRDFVRREWPHYMFQDYIPQREFRAPDEGRTLHLVGMQLCHDQVSHGAGVFRGSDEFVINVHQGRGKLFHALVRA